MKAILMLVHVMLAVVAIYLAINAGGQALLCLNDYQLVMHRVTSQPSMATSQFSFLNAQGYAYQLVIVALLTTGLALGFRRPAWYVATGISWIGVAYLLLRFTIIYRN